MTTRTAWPENVIARYLTVGGATVDLTYQLTVHNPPQPYATLAKCMGCPATEERSHYRTYYSSGGFVSDTVEEHEPDAADAQARTWAQAHAATCRALPKPSA
ncbi:hypothetical protein [Streptomyces diastaticus]|uniref:hypothetical protein n=1 Tax=Streptomyces diastaticus TaxID=1956 RepID=UPI00344BD6E4